jgi:small-conductance mechanosensitive channel
VHDIVSGIFFMADDAFRIGEYIDTGKAKGSVEGMSVRSLRLRHQNGQIHVIPFGQIQQVTNFSRDWTTVKFNLRLQLNTDIEKVRKTVKQIGAEMMQDPVFAAELFQPLKMQGVTDIDPNGLIVRLKFTARPVQPSLIQREALKRISKHFREKGIEFASANMMVQTVTGPGAAVEAAKAAPLAASTAAGTPQG